MSIRSSNANTLQAPSPSIPRTWTFSPSQQATISNRQRQMWRNRLPLRPAGRGREGGSDNSLVDVVRLRSQRIFRLLERDLPLLSLSSTYPSLPLALPPPGVRSCRHVCHLRTLSLPCRRRLPLPRAVCLRPPERKSSVCPPCWLLISAGKLSAFPRALAANCCGFTFAWIEIRYVRCDWLVCLWMLPVVRFCILAAAGTVVPTRAACRAKHARGASRESVVRASSNGNVRVALDHCWMCDDSFHRATGTRHLTLHASKVLVIDTTRRRDNCVSCNCARRDVALGA